MTRLVSLLVGSVVMVALVLWAASEYLGGPPSAGGSAEPAAAGASTPQECTCAQPAPPVDPEVFCARCREGLTVATQGSHSAKAHTATLLH